VIRARRCIVACAVAGFALRAAFALVYWTGQPLTHDEREYLALARSLARGDGYRYPADEPDPGTGQQFGRAPGYPAFLATFIVAEPVDHVPVRVQLVQCAVGAAGVWLMALAARRAGGARAGCAAAAIAALYPPLVWSPSYALSETLFSTVALSAALVLTPAKGDGPLYSHGMRTVTFGGALTGIAILIRPVMVFFLPLATLWMWGKRAYAAAALFVVIALLVVLPWTIRNHHVYGRWIAVASEGGVTFWTGNHPLARGDGDLAANPDLKRAELAFRAAHPGLTPEQLEPLYYRDALAWIGGNPGAWLTLEMRKAFYSIVPAGPSYAVHSSKYVAASVVSYAMALVAAGAGLWRWRRAATRGSTGPAPIALWLMAAATILSGLVFFPQERFRLPIVDPALIVTAALFWIREE
jgi:hypothetical protein